MLTQFTLIRHGEPSTPHLLLGRTNPKLTDKGYLQMSEGLAGCQFDRIISSPLSRCADFARLYGTKHGQAFAIDSRLQEIDFGEWDGQPLKDLWQQSDKRFEQFWQQPWSNVPPAGESTDSLLNRVTTVIQELTQRFNGEHILLVTHSGVMRVLLSWLLMGEHTGNAHLSRVELKHGARLSIGVFLDESGVQWPQLLGLNNS